MGTAYEQTLAAVGGTPPYSNWVLSSGALPPGLVLNAGTGAITGTPLSGAGSPYRFSVIVMDSAGVSAPEPQAETSRLVCAVHVRIDHAADAVFPN